VGELITHIEPANLAQLPRAVQSIPDPDVCSDSSTLQSDIVPPPRALEIPLVRVRQAIAQAHVHVGAGRYAQALTEASVAAYDARNLDYPPVLAEALVVQGHARMMLADRRAAIPIFDEATAVAVASRADALAVEAWARRAFLEGTSTGPGGALDGINLIEPLAQRIEGAAFARALLYNNIGCVELTRDREDSKTRARDYFRRALGESRGVISEGALELLTIRANIGMSTEDRVEGDRLLVEVTEERARRLGAEHPDTLESRWLRGTVTIEDLRQAAELLTPVCRAYEQHTTLTRERAQCWTELGLLRWELGESDAAMRALEQAVAVRGDAPEAMPYLTLLRGDVPAAVRQFAEAIAQHPVTPSDNWWDRLSHACLTLGLGRARRAAEDLPGARRALEATVAELQQIVRSHGGTAYERRLGRARVELALVLTGTGASPADRAVAAAAAVAWLRRVGSSSIELEQLADPIRDAAR
jgi:tetratricopeptide (TPR) repeat protein